MRPRPAPAPGITRQDVFAVLGALSALLTLVTAVLFYFGWRRSDVQARAMGVDVSLFGFSSSDYVLRSISALYLPLLVALGLLLAAGLLHGRVLAGLQAPAWRVPGRRERAAAAAARVARGAIWTAAACVGLVLAAGLPSLPGAVETAAARLQEQQWLVPLVLVAAVLVATCGGWLAQRLRPPVRPAASSPWAALLPPLVAAGAVLLGTFWLLEEYASAVGRGQAVQLAQGVDRLPRAVVLSARPLHLDVPGVAEQRLPATGGGPQDAAGFRTTGLRLLARSGGKVVLLHDGWEPRTGTVVVLPDSDELTWQFSR